MEGQDPKKTTITTAISSENKDMKILRIGCFWIYYIEVHNAFSNINFLLKMKLIMWVKFTLNLTKTVINFVKVIGITVPKKAHSRH